VEMGTELEGQETIFADEDLEDDGDGDFGDE
jgi:hypothetical protein